MVLPFFPAGLILAIAGSGRRRRTQRCKSPPPDSDSFSDAESGESLPAWQDKLRVKSPGMRICAARRAVFVAASLCRGAGGEGVLLQARPHSAVATEGRISTDFLLRPARQACSFAPHHALFGCLNPALSSERRLFAFVSLAHQSSLLVAEFFGSVARLSGAL